jgi:hypothetical protein
MKTGGLRPAGAFAHRDAAKMALAQVVNIVATWQAFCLAKPTQFRYTA